MADTLARRKQAKAKMFSERIWETGKKDLAESGVQNAQDAEQVCRREAQKCYAEWQKLRNIRADTPAVSSPETFEPTVSFICGEWADKVCSAVAETASAELEEGISADMLAKTRDLAKSMFTAATLEIAASAREAAIKASKGRWEEKQNQMIADIRKALVPSNGEIEENPEELSAAVERWASSVVVPPSQQEFKEFSKKAHKAASDLLESVSAEISVANYNAL